MTPCRVVAPAAQLCTLTKTKTLITHFYCDINDHHLTKMTNDEVHELVKALGRPGLLCLAGVAWAAVWIGTTLH